MAQSTFRRLAEELAKAFAELLPEFADTDAFEDYLAKLGWEVTGLPPDYAAFATKLQSFVEVDLAALLEAEDDLPADAVVSLLDPLERLFSDLLNLPAPDGSNPGTPLAELGRAIADDLGARYLATHWPAIYWTLLQAGVISYSYETPAGSGRIPFGRTRFHYEKVPGWLKDPTSFLRDRFQWGTDSFDFPGFADVAAEFLSAVGVGARRLVVERDLDLGFQGPGALLPRMSDRLEIPIVQVPMDEGHLELSLDMLPLPPKAPDKPGIIFQPRLPIATGTSVDAGDFQFRIIGHADSVYGVAVLPDRVELRYPFAGATLPESGLHLELELNPEEKFLLLGRPSASRLEMEGFILRLKTAARGDGTEVVVSLAPKDLQLTVVVSEGDSFLGRLVGGKSLEAKLDLGVEWSSQTGFRFTGGAGLTVESGLVVDLGFARLEGFRISIAGRLDSDGVNSLVASVETRPRALLGPVEATIDGVGVALTVEFRDGNAGPVDLDVGFKPPRGVGLAISSGPVAGAGFLTFDFDEGRYAGALALRIYEISLSAFGIIETKLPDGSEGFSFAIIISAKFTPIPLGFGFTLNGVGGMLGINRTVDVDLLQDAVRKHTLDHVLFPEEPEKNALAILKDLGAFFPAAEGRYTFGPMAIIGWGGGTALILEAELGIILELPEPVRLVILGQIKVGLPDLKNRFVKLNFDIVGALDFAKKTFSLDASMYDSQVGGFDLSGDMALRVNWGDQPNFVLSIGGFHPQYRAPAGFPKLKRVTVALAKNGNPSITISGYLAVTSNTFQIGAKAEILAHKGSFNVYGWIGFDALIIFQPFGFRADFSAGVALRKGTRHWASIHLSGSLSGPNPWRASGEACLSLFLFDICVGFDVELSKRKAQVIEPLPPIIEKLIPELEAPRSWSTEPGPAAHQFVTLVEGAGSGSGPLLDPLGIAQVKQRIVPLEFKLDLYEHKTLGKNDPRKFRIKKVTLGGSESGVPLPGTPPVVKDYFARGQYQKLTDAQKLALPGFELMNAGAKVGLEGVDSGDLKDGTTDYETFIIDGPDVERDGDPSYELAGPLTEKLARRSAQALGGLPAHGPEKFAAAKVVAISLGDEPYTIATVAGLAPRNDLIHDAEERFGFVSKGAAQDILEAHLRANPGDRGTLQVVPRLELPNAA